MRIGDINKDNYESFARLLGIKNAKAPVIDRGVNKTDAYVYYGIPGMDITGKDPSSWQKIVDVSDDVRAKMIDIARKDFINNYGMSDGEEMNAVIRKYVLSIPENQRPSAAWTLAQINVNESQRLYNIVKEKNPSWQNGEPFDRSILTLTNYGLSENSVDIKV